MPSRHRDASKLKASLAKGASKQATGDSGSSSRSVAARAEDLLLFERLQTPLHGGAKGRLVGVFAVAGAFLGSGRE